MYLTEDFNRFEFDSRDGAKMPVEVLGNVTLLAKNLQVLRNEINQPIHINSGYRSVSHNAKVGGVYNSYHTKGMAADITVKGMKPKYVAKTIIKLIKK